MSSQASQPASATDRPFWILAGLLALHLLWLGRQLFFPDLVLSYPFLGSDSQDWLSNGFFLAGDDVRYSARAPLLPLVIAALDRTGLLDWLPLLLQLLAHSTGLAIYRLLRFDHPSRIAFPIALAWSLNFTWLTLSLEVMADVPAAALLTWALLCLRAAERDPRFHAAAGSLAGLSALAQPLALLLPLAWLPAVGLRRRSDLASGWLWAGMAALALPTALWYAVKLALVGSLSDTLNPNWSLLRLDADGLGYYFWAFPSFTGLVAALLTAVGFFYLLRRLRRDAWPLLVISFFAILLVFVVFVYDYNAKRFLSPIFCLSAILAAEGLSRLPAKVRPWVALATLATSLLPIPAGGHNPSVVAVWPVPPLYLQVQGEHTNKGTMILEPLSVRLVGRSLGQMLEESVHARVLEARRQPRPERKLEADAFVQDTAVLYLYDRPEETALRYPIVQRLGNLLRKRVFFLPFSEFKGLLEHLELDRVGPLDGRRVYRAELRGVDGTWLIVVPTRGEAGRFVREGIKEARATGENAPPPYGLAEARRIARRLGNAFPVVFSNPQIAKSWALYLPFVIETTELYVIEPSREPGSRRLLESGERLGRTVEEGIAITRFALLGQTWALIEEEAP